jgi:hypothetical protein
VGKTTTKTKPAAKTKTAKPTKATKPSGPVEVNGVRFGTFTDPQRGLKNNMASMVSPVLVTLDAKRWVMEASPSGMLMVAVPDGSDLDTRIVAPKTKDEEKGLAEVTKPARGGLNGLTLVMSIRPTDLDAPLAAAEKAHDAAVKLAGKAASDSAKKGEKQQAKRDAEAAVPLPKVKLDGRWFNARLVADALNVTAGDMSTSLRSIKGRGSPLLVVGWRQTDNGPRETGRALVMPINGEPTADTILVSLDAAAPPTVGLKLAADETKSAAKAAEIAKAAVKPLLNLAGPQGTACVNVRGDGSGTVVFEPRPTWETKPDLLTLGYQNGHGEASRLVQWLGRMATGARVVKHGRSTVAEIGGPTKVWVFVAMPGDDPDCLESSTGELVAIHSGGDEDGDVIAECDASDPVACSALWRTAAEAAGTSLTDLATLFRRPVKTGPLEVGDWVVAGKKSEVGKIMKLLPGAKPRATVLWVAAAEEQNVDLAKLSRTMPTEAERSLAVVAIFKDQTSSSDW